MLQNIILDNEYDPDIDDTESIFNYSGEKNFKQIKTLEAFADTTEMSLTFVGDFFPNLQKLRLNNSIIPSMRDISSSLVNLRFLSLAHCKLTNLDGIATISPRLEELYLAFNKITDIYELMSLNRLKVLDIEHNRIPDVDSVSFLNACQKLKALTLIGNPCSNSKTYRKDIMEKMPQIIYLDEKRLRPKTPKSKPTNLLITPKNGKEKDKDKDKENIHENLSSSTLQKKVVIKDFDVVNKSPCNIKSLSSKNQINDHSVPCIGLKSLLSTLKEIDDGNSIMTEQISDAVNNRPPSARAYIDPSLKKEFQSPIIHQRQLNPKKIVTPQFKRPFSAHKLTRSECTD